MRRWHERGAKRIGGVKKSGRKIFCHDLAAEKKGRGGGGFPSRFRAHLFLLSCYFLFIFVPTFCPSPVFSFLSRLLRLLP